MRSLLVVTHRTCNQRCGYCTARAPFDDRAAVATAAVRARVLAVARERPAELVLSGGEPAMRNDLEALVADARRAGAVGVTLETNATLIDGARARALRAAGLTLARVNLSAWGDALDALTEDPGGFVRARAGIRALLDAGVPVEVSAAVVRATAPTLGALPALLVETFGSALQALRLRVPVDSPDPAQLVGVAEARDAVLAASLASRRVGLAVKFSPDSSPPPCVFPQPAAVSSLYALTPGARPRDDHAHLPGCAACVVRDRCPGFARPLLVREPDLAAVPITADRLRRRLSLVASVEEQVRRELVQPSRYVSPRTGEIVEESLVRVNFHCNQACGFCFVSTHLPPPPDTVVRAAIIEAARAGRQVTLTGGEPTLNPALADYVALARDHGRHPVALQTNAVRLADPSLVASLVDAGLRWVQVSLHAVSAALSDAITEAPGTFVQTLAGIDALYARPELDVVINFVIVRRNHGDLAPLVRLAAARWPRATVSVSFVAASSDVVPHDRELVPRYSDVLPDLAAAASEATRLGVEFRGFESMCGFPLCVVPADVRPQVVAEVPDGYDAGEFVYVEACKGCILRGRCYGVRRGYRALYGEGELRPVTG